MYVLVWMCGYSSIRTASNICNVCLYSSEYVYCGRENEHIFISKCIILVYGGLIVCINYQFGRKLISPYMHISSFY